MTVYLIAANVRPSLFKDLSQSEESWIASDRKLLILRMERCWSGRSGTLGKRCGGLTQRHTKTLVLVVPQRLSLARISLDVPP